MAGRIPASDMKAIGSDRISIHGKFRPDGSSGIVSGTDTGIGWSVARTGTGKYLLTLDRGYPTFFPVSVAVRVADATETGVQWGDYTAATGSTGNTIEIFVHQATVQTDLTDDADNEISFHIIVQNNAGNY